ncbi:type II secretion system F family protein [Undibacterium oligocarboniphilum]|uniref:Type II secretory pathway component PulF n=1 Tax=Undibacterium oligocarboniphilum TaxID=666702 RepID=A0A850QI61_9BURK|nr:hypothetical protein [Undibacterium oligocarboniphilum]MBC3871446.1 hypothetical protein [Undibacterium oligocarboniphilum]NVO78978.1 hypothetical protein [Undibacterium oligocarboniphilum]
MAFDINFKMTVWEFKSLRGEFYQDLSQTMKSMPGVAIVTVIERYAQRYAKDTIGKMCAHWLKQIVHFGRFSEAITGTVPPQDLAFLAAAEKSGDLTNALGYLGRNIIAMDKAKKGVISTLVASFFMFLIFHVFLGIEAFMVLPKLEEVMKTNIDINQLGTLGATLFGISHVVKAWWWLVVSVEISTVVLVYWSMDNYTGKFRKWLDDHVLPYQLYRDFVGAGFVVNVGALTSIGGSQIMSLNDSISAIRFKSKLRWLNWQIDEIQNNLLIRPNSKAEIFNTGIVAKKMYFRMLDISDYKEMDEMLPDVAQLIMEWAPVEANKRAMTLRFSMLILCIALMLFIYGGTGDLIDQFKTLVELKNM